MQMLLVMVQSTVVTFLVAVWDDLRFSMAMIIPFGLSWLLQRRQPSTSVKRKVKRPSSHAMSMEVVNSVLYVTRLLCQFQVEQSTVVSLVVDMEVVIVSQRSLLLLLDIQACIIHLHR